MYFIWCVRLIVVIEWLVCGMTSAGYSPRTRRVVSAVTSLLARSRLGIWQEQRTGGVLCQRHCMVYIHVTEGVRGGAAGHVIGVVDRTAAGNVCQQHSVHRAGTLGMLLHAHTQIHGHRHSQLVYWPLLCRAEFYVKYLSLWKCSKKSSVFFYSLCMWVMLQEFPKLYSWGLTCSNCRKVGQLSQTESSSSSSHPVCEYWVVVVDTLYVSHTSIS